MDREFRFKLSDVLVFLFISPFVVFPVLWILNWPWSSANAPAWVQAIGSIAAVGVAIYIASMQERRQELAKQQRDRVVIKAIAEIARRGFMWIDQIHLLASEGEAGKQAERFHKAIDYVEREWQQVQSIRLVDLPDEPTLAAFTMLEHNLRSCIDSSRKYIAGAEGGELNFFCKSVTLNKQIVENISLRLAKAAS